MTTFDLMLLLIVSVVIQQALLGESFSVTMGVLVVLTLMGLDRVGYLGWPFPRLNGSLEGAPTILIARASCSRTG